MHRLDNYINDIEPRIKAIYDNAPKQEEPSLQVSLASYGWILLDAWVAWRTLRFLLKETYIDDSVHDKWFQTPSSYTANQLMSVWFFSDSTTNYIKLHTGKGFKELIDSTIQKKRNSSAHFTKGSTVTGADSQEIKNYFKTLSKVFLFYETGTFLQNICHKLSIQGYNSFKLIYSETESHAIGDFFDTIDSYSSCNSFSLICHDSEEREYIILFEEIGCKAGYRQRGEKAYHLKDVVNGQHSYKFFDNKGFYQQIDIFIECVEKCWDKQSVQ